MDRIVTLDEFIVRRQKEFAYATGELTNLLRDIGVAAKIINREVNKAGLVNILGIAGSENASGDDVQKLDVYANQELIACLKNSGECAGIASEEMDDFVPFEPIEGKQSKYVVVFDPLDGSSNIDVNVSVGTIFGIYRRKSDPDGPCQMADFMQKGEDMVAAGYVLYGTSTILVYTTGHGVNGFTLDPSLGEFCLSHQDIKIPKKGKYYSVNQGYYHMFKPEVRRYIDLCSDQNLKLRYIGSMVSDVHRILFQGGIFLYPSTNTYPNGKLRLLYECNPMGMIVEQAGGCAISATRERILDHQVDELHERSSIAIGSPEMVRELEGFLEGSKAVSS
ncbi:MAG: class 1 fructose-bisphosphatase [Saprospiraceae bacterium]|nr:class 1 fructose-bisphosphatase [Saprospiraceae bacterium]